ncbi:hypothetical protein FAI40_03985 [Acetobacteraceae bacterium]|nr:hypothetical protein FAI40_03985 [Acetobacteraceae bacterium]
MKARERILYCCAQRAGQSPAGCGQHFKRMNMQERRLDKVELEKAGMALFGERWKSPMAHALGLPSTRIREVMRDARPCPFSWTERISEILKAHMDKCQQALHTLE